MSFETHDIFEVLRDGRISTLLFPFFYIARKMVCNTGKVEESGILILIPYCLVLSRFFSINFCVEKLVPLVLI